MRAKGADVDFAKLLSSEPDRGVTNIRNVDSTHWRPWLGLEHRCLVPFTSFSEFGKRHGGNVWFEAMFCSKAFTRRLSLGRGRVDRRSCPSAPTLGF